ncbi:efflux RND transporter permease subunit, partial [Acinetobacter baumannii]
YNKGAPVRLSDVAEVTDGVQDIRNYGSANGKASVLLIISRQPGANIIDTVDAINETLPYLRNTIPAQINLDVMMDRTPTIRASLKDV